MKLITINESIKLFEKKHNKTFNESYEITVKSILKHIENILTK